jgi:hypothetical protein
MPIYQMTREMPYDEFLGWLSYFDARPIEWRADDRAAKMIQSQGVKAKPHELFHSLDAIYNRRPGGPLKEGQVDTNNLKGSALFNKLFSAQGGEKLEFLHGSNQSVQESI